MRINIIGLDLETDTEIFVDKRDGSECRSAIIVQWATFGENGSVVGKDQTDLYRHIKTLHDASGLRSPNHIWVHNLNFDGEFLVQQLLWRFSVFYGGNNDITFVRPNRQLMQIRITDGQHLTVFKCSYKKSLLPLKAIGKAMGVEKLDPPYKLTEGWSKKLRGTPDETEYVAQDAKIVYEYISWAYSKGLKKLTASSDAYAEMKKIWTGLCCRDDRESWYRHYPRRIVKYDDSIRSAYGGGENHSKPGIYIDPEVKWFKDPKLDGVAVSYGKIHMRDFTSMYPSVMSFDLLPYGLPIGGGWVDTITDNTDLFFIRGLFDIRLKTGGIPFLTWKYASAEDRLKFDKRSVDPMNETPEPMMMIFTSVDYEELFDNYDVTVQGPEYLCFYGEYGPFRECVKQKFDEKTRLKLAGLDGTIDYAAVKIQINSMYGKTGQNPRMDATDYVWEGPKVGWKSKVETADEETFDSYPPVAMFITAHARRRLNLLMKAVGFENVIHADTDSVAWIGDCPSLPFEDGVELGTIADESGGRGFGVWLEYGKKKYLAYKGFEAPKAVKDIKFSCAGLSRRYSDDSNAVPTGPWVEALAEPLNLFDDEHVYGHESYHVPDGWIGDLYDINGVDRDQYTMGLKHTRVPGGVWLKPEAKNLKRQWKFNRG